MKTGRVTTFSYDGLNRLKTTTKFDKSSEILGYDNVGHLVSRTMANKMRWQAVYNSTTGQKTSENLASGNAADGSATKNSYTFAYNSSTAALGAGLIKTVTDGRNVVTNYTGYSSFNRPTNITFTGSAGVVSFSRNLTYDNRGNPTDLKDNYGTVAPSTEVLRSYDAVGQLLSDEVRSNVGNFSANSTLTSTNTVSNITQSWDAEGRRSNLAYNSGGTNYPLFDYAFNAAGQLTSVAEHVTGFAGGDSTYSYTYDTNGLLLTRANRFRNVTLGNFTLRGQPGSVTSIEGSAYGSPQARLTETLSWNADGRLGSVALINNLANATSAGETRAYGYDTDGHLQNETFGAVYAGSPATANTTYGFDAGSYNGTLGVRVSANTTFLLANGSVRNVSNVTAQSAAFNNAGLFVNGTASINGFGRPAGETQNITVPGSGGIIASTGNFAGVQFGLNITNALITSANHTFEIASTNGATGNLNFNITPNSTYNPNGTTSARHDWNIPLMLWPGNFSLTAYLANTTAGAPANSTYSFTTSNYTISPASATGALNITYDNNGFVTARTWFWNNMTAIAYPTGTPFNVDKQVLSDTLTWDAAGRLLLVTRRDAQNNGFDERSVYDPLGRRIHVTDKPTGSTLAPDMITSIYDPQVEFLEIGAQQSTTTATITGFPPQNTTATLITSVWKSFTGPTRVEPMAASRAWVDWRP